MTTIPSSLPLSSASRAQTPTAPTARNDIDKEAFLKLLIAQLKYQDPLAPTDPQDFMSQTAQFTQLETLTSISKQNEAAAKSQNLSTGSSMLGRTVTYLAEDGTSKSGVVSGAQLTADGVSLRVGSGFTTLDRVTEIKTTTSTTTGSA